MGFALILLFAAHAALAGGFPRSARSAAMSSAGAGIHARESAQMNRLMAISAAAIVTAGASAQNAVQWRVEDGGNGHWYRRTAAQLRWPESEALAESLGGHLVSILSEPEQAFLHSHFNLGAYWIGAHRSAANSNLFEWSDGSPFVFSNWRPGEPSGCNPCGNSPYVCDSASLLGWDDTGYFINGDSTDPGFTSVIEFSADCNHDGIVDYGQTLVGELADLNGNNIPDCCEAGPPCGCAGDTNNDGFVDGIDLATILTRWAQSATQFPNADCNRDGVIDGSDLTIVLGSWGACP
jgi:hypothetical protein